MVEGKPQSPSFKANENIFVSPNIIPLTVCYAHQGVLCLQLPEIYYIFI